jgi:D-glycero-alpha-D-manno-heptose-7-phosphate kinase
VPNREKTIYRSPTRVDLCGGTLDLWPIHQVLPPSATVNVAVSLWAEVEIESSSQTEFISTDQNLSKTYRSLDTAIQDSNHLPLVSLICAQVPEEFRHENIRIQTKALSPAGAGLGGSSCLAVTLLSALRDFFSLPPLEDHTLVQTCQDLEARLIHTPTGVQDYWGALRGGLNILQYPPGGVEVKTLPIPSQLNQHMLLVHSGQSRASAINNWEVFKAVFNRDKKVIGYLSEIADISLAASTQIDHLPSLLKLVEKEWQLRCQLWPDITTPQTRHVDALCLEAGCLFTRVCGAGGGGVLAVFFNQDSPEAMTTKLKAKGLQVLEAPLSTNGTHRA